MIKLDFVTAIAIFLIIPILFVFIRWVFYNCYRNEGLDYQSDYLQQCPYCNYLFFCYDNASMRECPRCHSLIASAEDAGKEEGHDKISEKDPQ